MHRYYAIYKPYKMLSQFVPVKKKRTLAQIEYVFAEGTHALGRLDDNTEGLLLLTNDKSVTALLMHPSQKHRRVYWVQVHGTVEQESLDTLQKGVPIRLENLDYITLPCEAKIIPAPENLPPRAHPVGTHFATTWIELVLYEGKFHQVRKMTAVIGHQTMRLIRISMEDMHLPDFIPGSVKEFSKEEFFGKLRLNTPPS
ncbi:MAG: pseudouridine synthase [Bacteroidetes bacterium]|jgi:23S rRNA pseudouridine2457 synthase|nr:pseudouridine synthase [Bacteroidota bacterium]